MRQKFTWKSGVVPRDLFDLYTLPSVHFFWKTSVESSPRNALTWSLSLASEDSDLNHHHNFLTILAQIKHVWNCINKLKIIRLFFTSVHGIEHSSSNVISLITVLLVLLLIHTNVTAVFIILLLQSLRTLVLNKDRFGKWKRLSYLRRVSWLGPSGPGSQCTSGHTRNFGSRNSTCNLSKGSDGQQHMQDCREHPHAHSPRSLKKPSQNMI